MNEIQLKSLAELLGKNFFIPNYQRGYRWDEQQVKDLLCDINNFAQKHPAKGEFYCLQPLVVRKMTAECKAQTEMLLPEEEWYEVVDGQQRLTTIYLILQAYHKQIEIMKLPTECFRLVFERGLDVSDVEGLGTEISMEASIDKYHLGCAFRLIKRFLDEKSFMVIDFCKALLYNNPVLDKDGKTINDEANNVRFIWYEIDDDEDTIEVFRNLNHGKISLTNSELVRALMLKSTNFGTETNETRLRQQEIAQDWDEMEYKLQDETFWSFLRKEPWTNPTRIEFIFDLICKQNALDINEETFKTIGEDRYRMDRRGKNREMLQEVQDTVLRARTMDTGGEESPLELHPPRQFDEPRLR